MWANTSITFIFSARTMKEMWFMKSREVKLHWLLEHMTGRKSRGQLGLIWSGTSIKNLFGSFLNWKLGRTPWLYTVQFCSVCSTSILKSTKLTRTYDFIYLSFIGKKSQFHLAYLPSAPNLIVLTQQVSFISFVILTDDAKRKWFSPQWIVRT